MRHNPSPHLCPHCGTVSRQPSIPVTRPQQLREGDAVVFFSTPLATVLRGTWLGMDPQFPWEGRVLVVSKRYERVGGSARLLIEPGRVWREGARQGVLSL